MEQITHEQDAASPPQVLAADDDALGARLLGMFLQRLGFVGTVVSSGVEVLAQLEGRHFDLVLLDVEMPGKGGFATLQDIQSHGWTVPVIAVTGHAEAEFRERCLTAGFAGYVSKPLRLSELEVEIRRVLQQPVQAPVASGSPVVASSSLDGLARELEIEPATFALLLRAFLITGPQDVAAMVAAATRGDTRLTQHHAHRLRGSLGSLAVHDLATLAADIERQAHDGQLAAADAALHAFNTGFHAFCTHVDGWLKRQDALPS